MSVLDYINKMKEMYEGERIMNQEPRNMYQDGQLVAPSVDGSRPGYSGDFTQIEKGIYQNKKGKYKIKGQREKKYIDKTFPKGTKLAHVKRALNQWYGENPIKVKWKEGQKIKLISEGKAGEQVVTDIVYKSKKIENDFINALKDFGGENKGNWTKAKLTEKFGKVYDLASTFVRKQNPTLVRDTNKVFSLKYADELEAAGFKDWDAAKKANKQSAIKASYQRKIDPYVKKGFDVSRKQLAKNIDALDDFEKSGQTLEDFYENVKDRQFKKNLRAYMRGEAGPFVTDAWDEAGFKSKYKNIIPKMKKHLEVWHEQSDPLGKTKAQIKKGKIKKFSRLDVENLIGKAKRVKKTDYDGILDLAHRQDLIIDQNISELGIERPEINRVLIKDAEIERNKLHKKNYALVDEIKKGKNVQKNLSLIAGNNHRIQQISKVTNGRLSGIIMDTETLSPVKLTPSNIMGVDAGVFNKPIKEMTEVDKIYLKNKILPTVINEAKAMTPEKIASELSGIMDDEVLSKKLATRMENLKTGRQITQTVFDRSKQVYRFMKNAGFKIDKCLSSGGRVKLQGGGGVNTCIRGVIEAEQKSAMKGNKISKAKFGKFGKLARAGAWFLGPIDIPIELAFALPHMLAGDKEAAKRATTLGLFGYGKDKLDEIKAGSPESYKYLKHMKDNDDYIDAYFSAEDAKLNLDKLKDLPEHVQQEKKFIYNDQKLKAEEKMDSIMKGYEGYFDEEGKFDVWGEARGKSATQDYLIKDVTEKTDKGLDMKEYGGHGMNIALGLPWNFGMKEGIAPFKGGKPITNLKQYIAQRGQPYWKQLEHAAYEAGRPEFFDNYLVGGGIEKKGSMRKYKDPDTGEIKYDVDMGSKDVRDLYSELPIKYASQLGKLEKEEMLRGLKAKGLHGTVGFKKMLEAQGIDPQEVRDVGKKDWEFDILGKRHIGRADGGRAGYMGGGIAAIRKPYAIPPERQGLRSIMINVNDD